MYNHNRHFSVFSTGYPSFYSGRFQVEACSDIPRGSWCGRASWVALRLRWTWAFMKRNCRKTSVTEFRGRRPEQLSQESKKNIGLEVSTRWKKSCSEVAKEILVCRNKKVSRHAVCQLRVREGSKPWHEFCSFLREWSEGDFLHLPVSDKFFVYFSRTPNSQKDVTWS